MAVKVNQIYAELEGKKRYLRVDELDGDDAVCTAGWRARANQIVWSSRRPVLAQDVLEDTALFRLEYDV